MWNVILKCERGACRREKELAFFPISGLPKPWKRKNADEENHFVSVLIRRRKEERKI